MAVSMFWHNLRRSFLRGGIALSVFTVFGLLDIAMSPNAAPNAPLPGALFFAATIATLLLWKVALRWSFFPEDEPRVVSEATAAGNVQFFSSTAAELVAAQAPALAFTAVFICCAAPPPKLRVEPRAYTRAESAVATYRIEL